MGGDGDPAQIEPVRIPTGLDREVRFRKAVRVVGAGVVEQVEFILTQVEQLAMTSKLHLLGLTKEQFEANAEANKSTSKKGREVGIIRKGVYSKNVDNDSDIYTLGSIVGVSVNTKMDPETAYQVTKTFWDGAKKNVKSHPWLATMSMDYGVRDNGMKLHPGAARYYKEKGVAIPEGSL